jgi:adenylate kinase
MNIVLLGAPGSGKGTQAKKIAEAYGLTHVSTGEIFRDEIANKTELGQKVQGFVSTGKLVPDDVVIEVLATKLDNLNGGSFLLDGFPRTAEQAYALDSYLKKSDRDLGGIIYIEVPVAELVKRLGGRWTCSKCNSVYNTDSQPPKEAGKCDKDGTALFQREDDKPESIQKRLRVYDEQTKPLVAYYKKSVPFYPIDGAQAPEQVFGQIQGHLGEPKAAR